MTHAVTAAGAFAAGVATTLVVTRIVATYLVKLRRKAEEDS